MRLKIADNVVVIAGKDLGKTGKIVAIDQKKGKVTVAGVNILKKFVKRTSENKGGIIPMEFPLNASNVMLLDPKTKQATKIAYRIVDGKKERYAKKSGTTLVDIVKSKIKKK